MKTSPIFWKIGLLLGATMLSVAGPSNENSYSHGVSIQGSNIQKHYEGYKCVQTGSVITAIGSETVHSKYIKQALGNDNGVNLTYSFCLNVDLCDARLQAVSQSDGQLWLDLNMGLLYSKSASSFDLSFVFQNHLCFASDFVKESNLESTGWWDDFVRGVNTRTLSQAGSVTPAIQFAWGALADPVAGLLNIASASVAGRNYQSNVGQKPVYTTDFAYPGIVTNQEDNAYTSWKFGDTNMKEAGCEVFAGYNLAHLMKKDISLASVILLYEELGIKVGKIGGRLGSNPFQIWFFLDAMGIKYTKINSFKDYENLVTNSQNYYFICSSWNNEYWNSSLHTFLLEKTKANNLRGFNVIPQTTPTMRTGAQNSLSCNAKLASTLFVTGYAVERNNI